MEGMSLKDCVVDSDFNVNPDVLPIGLYNPDSNGVVYWLANKLDDGTFSTAFWSEVDYKRNCLQADEYNSIQQVYNARDELIKAGSKFMKKPSMKIRDTAGFEREPNRKERRYMAKKMEHFSKMEARKEGRQ